MLQNNFEVQILINGNPVKEYCHNGKTYIEGKAGSRYSLKIKNNSCQRILVIPSVDGLSVLNGELANKKSGGYIIDSYDSLVIDGWRKSDNEVAQFLFSRPENSYAEKTGKGQNQGVIGALIYCEEPRKRKGYEIKVSDNLSVDYPPFRSGDLVERGGQSLLDCSFSAQSASPAEQGVGTGWGNSKESNVTRVSFSKESFSSAVLEIYYNTKKELKKFGIDFGSKPIYVSPEAFPGEYCKPPSR